MLMHGLQLKKQTEDELITIATCLEKLGALLVSIAESENSECLLYHVSVIGDVISDYGKVLVEELSGAKIIFNINKVNVDQCVDS